MKPFVKLNNAKGENVAGIFSRVYRRGPNTYLGLLSRGTQENVVLHFPKEAYLYEMGERDFLEYSNKTQVSLKPVIGKMLAILPYKVSGISIELPPRVKQGAALCWKAILKAESGQVGDHVFNVTVTAPNGEKSKSWSGNELAMKGILDREWNIAFNELPGKWAITVRDSVSGKEAQASFIVTESED